MDHRNLSLLDLAVRLIEKRRSFLATVFGVGLVTAALTFVVPKWYSAKVTLLPPKEESSDFGVSSLLSKLPVGGMGLGLGLGTLSEETNLYLALLNSRTVQELVVDRFDLRRRYKKKTMQETLKALSKNISIEINEDNTISLTVKASTSYFPNKEQEEEAKRLCADMANFFIQKMDSVNKEVRVEKAKRSRLFIEKRYQQNLKDLQQAEDSLRTLQQKYGMIALEEQTRAIISTIAELKANIIAKEVEIGVLLFEKSKDHPEIKFAQKELDELKRKYNELMSSASFNRSKGRGDIIIPFESLPDVSLEYLRLYREVKIQEMVLEFLYPQYEQAKIQEERDTPTVQVLDYAVPPELKTKPKRLLMTAVSMILAAFVYVLGTAYQLQIERLQELDPEKYRRYAAFKKALQSSFSLSRTK